MNFHQFELGDFGIFDSRVKFPNVAVTKKRTVKAFEIEIFPNNFEGTFHINGIPYSASKGTVVCAKPGQERYSKLPFMCYYLHMSPKNEEAKRLLFGLPDVMNLGDVSEYIDIFNKLIRADFKNEDMKSLFISSSVSQILSLILRDFDIEAFEAGVIGNKRALLIAEKYLRKNYKKNITLDELSKVANISPIYFHKLFTAYFHKTPNKYLLDIRISHAKTRLLKEEYCLSDIAFECGFSSQSYFCFKFKEAVGKSPLKYRKSVLTRAEI
ncbi:MAG: helix-turn-helix transcriptional regulator [Clostridia bacterium]|nr:helix-turn-helix transcriptional regulator [Clostridia bacterium]